MSQKFLNRCLSLSKAEGKIHGIRKWFFPLPMSFRRNLNYLKTNMKIFHPRWFRLRSITVLFITTLGAWACRRHILTSHLGAWACRRHHYFYCIKICALNRTSLMFLWELKNAIISTNFRELCDIKTNTKNPHTHSGFDKLSHQLFHYTLPEPVEGTLFLLN